MFDQLFSRPRAVQQYLRAPLLESRLRYLQHCAAQGATSATLRNVALYQRALCGSLDLEAASLVRLEQIEAAASRWIARTPASHAQKTGHASKTAFVSIARGWLGFLNRLAPVEKAEPPCRGLIADFREYMQSERGLSPATVYTRCLRVEEFLARYCADPGALGQMTMVQIDAAIAEKGVRDRCTRASIRTYAYVLRSFFRYAETRGWCGHGLAAGIVSPRVYTGESLPAGPTWAQVQRLCARAEGDAPAQVRDRAILLLLVVYGLRVGEVRRVRLDDVDWHAETIRITRSKQQRRIQSYPLAGVVGDALLQYLKTARPRRAAREVFLSLKAPIRPLGNSAFWQIVNRRLRPMGLSLAHHGPHVLRHACATHLLSRGLPLKEIGDHLGHRNPATTRVYAKVDLVGLRQVADFSLEGLV
jgi:site-specific recombinase XerD